MGRVLASHARATIVTVGAAAAVLLAGCSDGAGAQPGPSRGGPSSRATTSTSTASASPTTTAEPSGTASVAVPAAARAHTDEGAKAFAKYYYETAATSYVTLQTAPLLFLSLPSCVGCRAMVRAVDKQREVGEHLEAASLTIKLVELRSSAKGRAEVDVAGSEKPVRVIDQQGNVVRTTNAGVVTFRTQLIWTPEGWRVSTMTLV